MLWVAFRLDAEGGLRGLRRADEEGVDATISASPSTRMTSSEVGRFVIPAATLLLGVDCSWDDIGRLGESDADDRGLLSPEGFGAATSSFELSSASSRSDPVERRRVLRLLEGPAREREDDARDGVDPDAGRRPEEGMCLSASLLFSSSTSVPSSSSDTPAALADLVDPMSSCDCV